MSCLIVGQRATVREQLCNYCATRNATVFRTDSFFLVKTSKQRCSAAALVLDLAPDFGPHAYSEQFFPQILPGREWFISRFLGVQHNHS
jgi:hypothetical protein